MYSVEYWPGIWQNQSEMTLPFCDESSDEADALQDMPSQLQLFLATFYFAAGITFWTSLLSVDDEDGRGEYFGQWSEIYDMKNA